MKATFIFLITFLIICADINVSYAQTAIMSDKKNKKNLQISQPDRISVNSIGPGCQKSWSVDNYCLEWDVSTTNSEQKFKVFFQNPSNASTLHLDWVWMYQDDFSGEWKSFNNPKNPSSCSGHSNNVFKVESSNLQCLDVVRFKVCVTGVQTESTQNETKLDCGFNVTVTCFDD